MIFVDIEIPAGVADAVSYASGVLAERDRCAKIAEEFRNIIASAKFITESIAVKIRSGK